MSPDKGTSSCKEPEAGMSVEASERSTEEEKVVRQSGVGQRRLCGDLEITLRQKDRRHCYSGQSPG